MKIKIIVSTGLEHDNLSLQRKTIECDSYEKIIKVDSEQIDYKTYTFIKALEKNKQFENQIKKIRDKIGIPREGFTKKEYDSYCNNILCPSKHENAKKFWLWNEFVKIYNPSCKFPKYNWLGIKLRRSEVYANQVETLKSDYPKLWKYWQIWQKNLIKKSDIAGELIFHRIYN